MDRGKKWDALSIVAGVLCIGPEVVTDFHLGLPTDLASWEWLTIVPMTTIFLGLPQLVMLAYVSVVRSHPIRLVCVAGSVALLGYYYYRLITGDLSSSSTAAVGLFFLAFSMALTAMAVGAVALFIDRLMARHSTSS